MNEERCSICNQLLKLTLTPQTIHYGRLDCSKCGFRGWARNPISSKMGTTQEKRIGSRSVKDVCDFHKFKDEHCFFCQRTREQLGWAETLTIDHIEELDKGGEDKVWNNQILCSACHKLKNWARLYLNWHLNKGDKKDGDTNETTN